MATMNEIEVATGLFATKRAALAGVAAAYVHELESVRKRYLEQLRKTVGEAKAAHAQLGTLLQASPELFEKPRSVVFHGIKVGYVKEKGHMEIEDEAKTVLLIEKHFPEKADVLINVAKTPSKKALEQLPAADLKRLGVVITGDTDVCYAKDTAADVEKLVSAFLKDKAFDPETAAQKAAA